MRILTELNRVEVIDHTKPLEEGGGRTVIYYKPDNIHVEIQTQDEGKTLKIFLELDDADDTA